MGWFWVRRWYGRDVTACHASECVWCVVEGGIPECELGDPISIFTRCVSGRRNICGEMICHAMGHDQSDMTCSGDMTCSLMCGSQHLAYAQSGDGEAGLLRGGLI